MALTRVSPNMINRTGSTVGIFSGNGSQTTFTLPLAPQSVYSVLVSVSGVWQRPVTDFTVANSTLTFVSAPISGTNNILVYMV